VLFLIVLPGTCALLLFPNLPRPDLVYPNLILHLLPAGLVGLVVAGFIAATMVSIASMLNSASTLVTMDVIRQLKPHLTDSQVVRIGRASTVGLLAVAIVWAPQLQLLPSLWQYLQAVLAYAVPPVVALFLVGMFWRGANADGAAATMLLGSLCGFALFLINGVLGWTHFHFLYAAPILTALDASILVGVSRLGRGTAAASGAIAMWKFDFSRAEQMRLKLVPLWQDYRFQAAALLALTGAVVMAFR
jgi:SSS family solute:Na+ symporter